MRDEDILKSMRKKIVLMAYAAGMGHIAPAYSCLEIIYTLYNKGILRKEYDNFILSKGHGSLALYVNLQAAGYFEEEELMTFSMPGTRLGGEPKFGELPGVEATTGSLGHGLSLGVGRALAHKLDRNDAKTFVLVGDGECQEGSIWEAVMSANKLHLGNLIVILDCNRIQKMDFVEEILEINEWRNKFESFGWLVKEVDGHDVNAIEKSLKNLEIGDKPQLFIANTVKGKGVSIVENNPDWHWKIPSKRELKVFASELDISQEEIEYASSLY